MGNRLIRSSSSLTSMEKQENKGFNERLAIAKAAISSTLILNLIGNHVNKS